MECIEEAQNSSGVQIEEADNKQTGDMPQEES
jgi:hypothetical protein